MAMSSVLIFGRATFPAMGREHLREFRRKLGLTQEEMSSRLGLKRGSYAALELGTTKSVPKAIVRELRTMGYEGDVELPQTAAQSIDAPVPYIGAISAGRRADWTDPFESEDLAYVPSHMTEQRGTFACKVSGDSMVPMLWPGDLCVLVANPEPVVGRVVLARCADNLLTLKSLRHNGREWMLTPLNASYDSEPLDGMIVGYVVGLVRRDGDETLTRFAPGGLKAQSSI